MFTDRLPSLSPKIWMAFSLRSFHFKMICIFSSVSIDIQSGGNSLLSQFLKTRAFLFSFKVFPFALMVPHFFSQAGQWLGA